MDDLLKANANPEHIAHEFVAVIRDLMRAISVKGDPSAAIIRATERWEYLLQLMERSQECPSWDKLFDQAVMELRPKAEGDGIDGAIQEIARAGMALYVERTGVQSVAGQKENQLLRALAHFDLVRQGGLEW